MHKIFIISTLLATVLLANSIGQDEQYTNTNDKSIQPTTTTANNPIRPKNTHRTRADE